jgi:hypothetical protein
VPNTQAQGRPPASSAVPCQQTWRGCLRAHDQWCRIRGRSDKNLNHQNRWNTQIIQRYAINSGDILHIPLLKAKRRSTSHAFSVALSDSRMGCASLGIWFKL